MLLYNVYNCVSSDKLSSPESKIVSSMNCGPMPALSVSSVPGSLQGVALGITMKRFCRTGTPRNWTVDHFGSGQQSEKIYTRPSPRKTSKLTYTYTRARVYTTAGRSCILHETFLFVNSLIEINAFTWFYYYLFIYDTSQALS